MIFREELEADMIAKPILKVFKQNNDVDAFNFHEDMVPDTREELDLYMKLHYKQGIEVAQETAITNILEYNDDEEKQKRRLDEDQAVLGM